MVGWKQPASESAEKKTRSKCTAACASACLRGLSSDTHARTDAHIGPRMQMAEEFERGFDMQIECRLVFSAGCNAALSLLQHRIRADNIYLKGPVD